VALFCEILSKMSVLSKMALDKRQRLQDGGTRLPVCQGCLFYPRWRWISARDYKMVEHTYIPVCQGCLYYPRWRWISARDYKMVEHTYLYARAECSIQDGAG
jgi:hypothetical protein